MERNEQLSRFLSDMKIVVSTGDVDIEAYSVAEGQEYVNDTEPENLNKASSFTKIDDNTYQYTFPDGFNIYATIKNTYMYDNNYGTCILEKISLNENDIRKDMTIVIHMEEDNNLLSLMSEKDFTYVRNCFQFQETGCLIDSFIDFNNQPICYWASVLNDGEMSYSLKEKYLNTHNNFNCNNPDTKNIRNDMFKVCESHVENYPASGYVGSCKQFKLDVRDIVSSKQLEDGNYIFISKIRTSKGIREAVIRTSSKELDDVSSYLFMEWFDQTKHSDLIDMGNIYEEKVETRPINFSLLKSIGAEID